MKIVHLASELAPIAKVGGLGDMIFGLSRAQIFQGHEVEIILPKYDTLDLTLLEDLPVTLIEAPELFERGKIYGCSDDTTRFTTFCRLALDYLKGRAVDIFHLHDWHTAVAAPLLKEQYKELAAGCIFTIHNLAYQGECKEPVLDKLGWKSSKILEKGHYNLLRAGVVYADWVTTVSPTYAKEVLAQDPFLKQYEKKFSGILNGIDGSFWNPKTDPALPQNFSSKNLTPKFEVKQYLRRKLGLSPDDTPLVAAITRLVPQKSPELIEAALHHTLKLGGQFVLLGATSDNKTERHFKHLKQRVEKSGGAHLELTFDEKLSHLIFGAADLFLVPSLFEPCGLTQMIAMRYGALPLVRQTGGLADTIFEKENGFLFGPPTSEALVQTLERAFHLWKSSPDRWHTLQIAAMEGDYSWDLSAQAYLELYKKVSKSKNQELLKG